MLYKDTWYKNGITLVGDLISNNTRIVLSKNEIENMYSFKIKIFLDYFEVRDTRKTTKGDVLYIYMYKCILRASCVMLLLCKGLGERFPNPIYSAPCS